MIRTKSHFRGNGHFEEDGIQNYLVFQPMHRCFKIIAGAVNCSHICYWKSKGLCDEGIKSITKFNYSDILYLNYYGTKIKVTFN